jgi:histidyl-tRNA synthetase
MTPFQAPRGARDILPSDQAVVRHVRAVAERVAAQANFLPITTPTYEARALFQRAIGGGTDVMDKELFLVRGIKTDDTEESYALRPEGTAGIVRAFIEHGMHTLPQPVKLTSIVNNFRYDRPQKGRYREHTQWDIELFGDLSPWADAWVILTTWRFFTELGFDACHLTLHINSLGTAAERVAYQEQLVAFLQPHAATLSEDSQRRLQENPLRILDSKNAADQQLLEQAPTLRDVLGLESRAHFDEVLRLLRCWNIPVEENARLVRGLDYYAHTAFEWVPREQQGQQLSLGGGGRYDELLPQLGGPAVGAVGAGLGLERVCEFLAASELPIPPLPSLQYYLVSADETGRQYIETEVLPHLLAQGRSVDLGRQHDGVGNQLKRADKAGAIEAVIVGVQEIERGQLMVKTLADGSQRECALSEL